MKRLLNLTRKIFLSISIASLFLIFESNVIPVQARTDQQTSCSSWDLANDFRTYPDQENPNRDSCGTPGVWEFMGSVGLMRDPQNYYTLANFNPNANGVPGLNVWEGNRSDTLALLAYNASGSTQVFGAIVWPADTIDVHPAPDQLTVIAWHSPVSGYVSISGGVSDNDPVGGDGIQWFIDKDTVNLASGSYNNGGSQTFANGTNGASLNAVAVDVGDILYVMIHPNGSYYYDSTRVDLSITVTSAPTPIPSPTSTSTPSACASWTLANDFRTSPDQENPNRDSCNNLGVWEFLKSTDLNRNPANYTVMSGFTPALAGVTGLNSWYESSASVGHISFNASGTTYTSGAITWFPDTIDVHPGPAQTVVMAWHSPLTGYVSVTGGVSDNNPGCGDGISWYLDRNTTNVASGGYANGGSQLYANGAGGAGLNTLQVSVNDVIYLAIHPSGYWDCDDTRVDLSISVANPPTPTLMATTTYTPTVSPTSTPTATLTSTPTNTPTFTPTFTATSTPTLTFTQSDTPTITFTPSNTPTLTTYTPVPGTPQSNGNGPCWISGASWPVYNNVEYSIGDNTVPSSWTSYIQSAALTWTNISPSQFTLSQDQGSPNFIDVGAIDKSALRIALSLIYASSTEIEKVTTTFDINDNFDIVPSLNSYHVRNVMTHEFGHWIDLKDIYETGCEDVTMWHDISLGETKKVTVESADIAGINWQYP